MKKPVFTSFAEYFNEHPQESISEYIERLEREELQRQGKSPLTLEDYLRYDLETFLNLDEFAEIITLNGVALKAIVERHYEEIRRSSRGDDRLRLHASTPALIGDHMTIHFKAADYLRDRERLPKQSEACHVNDRLFHVISSTAEYGLATLELKADRMNKPLSPPRLPGLHEDLEDW